MLCAAMCLQHKAQTSRRILLALEHLDRSCLLLVPLAEAIVSFVEEELKAAGVGVDADSCARMAAAGAVAQGAGDAAGGAEAASGTLQLPDEQRKQGEGGGQSVAATTEQVLALLPHLPLASLHQLLAFLCLQLAWRLPIQQGVQDALQVRAGKPACMLARPTACPTAW